jgi:hypothetical protein
VVAVRVVGVPSVCGGRAAGCGRSAVTLQTACGGVPCVCDNCALRVWWPYGGLAVLQFQG